MAKCGGRWRAGALAVGLAAGLACGALPARAGDKATVAMKGADGRDIGTLELSETLAGVLILAKLKGLPPGAHGFHVVQKGICEPPFESAGAILNPLNAKHGLKHEEGPSMGNMPNLHVPASGELTVELLNPFVTLSTDADGSLIREGGTAFVIRANPDDHVTQPDGGSGARIACGVVKLKD